MSQNYRVLLSFTFNNALTAGFTERYDFNDGGGGDSFITTLAPKVVLARRLLLSTSWRISEVRVGTVTPKLSAKTGKYFNALKLLQLCPAIPGGNGNLGVADTPNSALYVRQKFSGLSRTVARQMRGIPDTWWESAALTNAAGQMTAFFSFLATIPQVEISTNRTTGSSVTHNLICSDIQRISSRRTGRPLLPLRGRRSKKRA